MAEMELAKRYESMLREWSALASAPMDAWDNGRMNALVDQTQAVQLALRQSDAGREAIERLAHDSDARVRGWAAVHAFAWNESLTRSVMNELLALGGMAALEAKWTLRTMDAGRLDVDWVPEPDRGSSIVENN